MSAKTMHEIRETLCTDLDQYAKKGTFTRNDLDTVHEITDTIKNIDKITAMEEEGYSYGSGDWNAMGSYSNGRMPMSTNYSGRRYRDDMNYENTNSGRRYMRNNYSNDSDNMNMDMENRMRREMYN